MESMPTLGTDNSSRLLHMEYALEKNLMDTKLKNLVDIITKMEGAGDIATLHTAMFQQPSSNAFGSNWRKTDRYRNAIEHCDFVAQDTALFPGSPCTNDNAPPPEIPTSICDEPPNTLRSGKWTTEEEEYTKQAITDFCSGTLNDCAEGMSLRAYLSQKLNCDPMRISKKLAGMKLGKKSYEHKGKRSTSDPADDRDGKRRR
jgi:hypothetical protein